MTVILPIFLLLMLVVLSLTRTKSWTKKGLFLLVSLIFIGLIACGTSENISSPQSGTANQGSTQINGVTQVSSSSTPSVEKKTRSSKTETSPNTSSTQKESITTNKKSVKDQYKTLANLEYNGKQVIEVNHDHAVFSKSEMSFAEGSWQSFSNLDSLNRAGAANAMLSKSLMPTAEREPLYVDPTGWKNNKIKVNGKEEWLYNRCHLIGYQLTGQNNSMKNLMTGTRSLNDPAMLVYEDKVASYIKTTNHHVRYQVEPIFRGNERVARGVHMQGESVEDQKIDFNVYIFNVEQGVTINYTDGSSRVQPNTTATN